MVNYDEIWQKCLEQKIQQKKDEYLSMLEYVGEIDNCLEIGSYDGGSSVGLHHISKKLYSVTMLNTQFLQEYISKYNASVYLGNTHDQTTLDYVKSLDVKFNFMFIDGDHTYDGVKQDFEMYKQFAVDGCKIAFHDILDIEEHRRQNCYVGKFWDEIKYNYTYKEFIADPKTWGGIGIITL